MRLILVPSKERTVEYDVKVRSLEASLQIITHLCEQPRAVRILYEESPATEWNEQHSSSTITIPLPPLPEPVSIGVAMGVLPQLCVTKPVGISYEEARAVSTEVAAITYGLAGVAV